jgi:glycosyltransferase involved in cell wall biosynthesis
MLRNAIMWLYARVEMFTARRADAVICTGPGLVRQVEGMKTGKPVYHIFDIPSSLQEADPRKTAAVREKLRQGPDDVIVTYVGSFAVYQGVDMMFEAMPRVVERCRNARFVIIGGTALEIEERNSLLEKKGMGGRVAWVGKISPDHLADYLAASDILLSPRLAGLNTPLKILDYLKAGRAIVATGVDSNRLLLDDKTTLLVDVDAESFAAGICRLIEDVELRNRLAANGSRLIREKFNFTEFKTLLGGCYDNLGMK